MKFAKVEVSEQHLEELIRLHADEIEAGLVYIDHQRQTDGGRLDVILADSGKAFVIAELKVTEDDGMLLQGVDYCDYVTRNIERLAREYKQHQIDPTQEVRLLLIAPSFSQTLINRCRWVNITISLFAFTCLIATRKSNVMASGAE
jgi:RecB family endonuclease NucS